MDRHGYRQCVPRNPDPAVDRAPLLDLSSGYVLRSADRFPKQGARAPWRVHQNYLMDILTLRLARVDDPALVFSRT
jgi:hypothetical protein